MADSDGKVRIEIEDNISEASKRMSGYEKQINNFDASGLQKGIDDLNKTINGLAEKFVDLSKPVQDDGKALKELEKIINSQNSAISELRKTCNGLTAELNNLKKPVDDNDKKLGDLNKSFDETTKSVNEAVQRLKELAFQGKATSQEFKNLQQYVNVTNRKISETNNIVNSATGGLGNQENAMAGLTGAATKLAGAYGLLQVATATINYSAQAVEAYRTQERAVLQLNQTLQNAGVYSAEYSAEIQKLANEIQSYSNYGNEVIIKAQAIGQAYAGNTKITEGLTKATIDFAAATGMDLESAFSLVGKSIGTSTNALGRYGVELNKGMSESQKMISIQAQLEKRYTGTAAKMADTSVQLREALGDLSKEFGNVLDPAVKRTQTELIKGVNALTSWIRHVRVLSTEISKLDIGGIDDRIRTAEASLARWQNTDRRKLNAGGNKLVDDNIAKQTKLIAELKSQREKLTSAESAKNNKPIKINDDLGGLSSLSSSSSSGGGATKIKDDYEKLQAAVQAARREIELAALAHGTSSQEVQNAFVKYNQLNTQLTSIGALFDNEKQKVDETKGAYQQLQERIQALKTELLNLGAEGGIGSEQFEQLKNEYISTMEQIKEVDGAITDKMGKDWDAVGKQISSALGSTLVNALKGGESAMQAFSSIAQSLLQQVLNKMIEMAIITPILNALTGGVGGTAANAAGSGGGGLLGGIGKLFKSENGNVFNYGNIVPFAKGGVVSKPTIFPMANGGTGLMGEAGAEAVMPLRRMSNGRLGVEASGNGEGGNAVQVNIYNQSGANVETRKRDDGSMDIIIKKVNEALMNERTSSGFRAAYSREDRKGLQAV